uniref:protein NRT1/ PTR FAMILY 5.6-like n=1 Tax=Erigeron canadensis TaxID=72917 RepID=UPI001CB965FB|nr:protein NRT1/ PTR FAMILY 5.6-like [Erigeron canadensis]
MENNGGEVDEQKWVYDSSLDHKGRLPLRASTGAWKASLFIIVIEFGERLSYFGLATSMIIYLTRVIHQDIKTAAKSVNYWTGVTTLMPLLGGFIADAYLGRFAMVLFSSAIYLMGLVLLTMSNMIPGLKPCSSHGICEEPRKIHEVVFFVAIYLISIGTGGHKPALESFGADQFDEDHETERKMKMSFFNLWNAGLCAGLLLSVTVIVYVQDNLGWGAADIILTTVLACSMAIFCVGMRFYRYRNATGSPLTPMVQVCVAAYAKRRLPHPSDATFLYELPKSEKSQQRLLCHTRSLKFLDKAAILEDEEHFNNNQHDPWKLSTVTKVEELKLLINIIPIWLTSLPFGICVAQTSTFFIKQASLLNREITHNFVIPPVSIYALSACGMILSVLVYDRVLVPLSRRLTGTERGIDILQRIGIGMVFSIMTMSISALVEKKRLNGVLSGSVSMSVFWLAPQFIIIGIADGFTLVGLQEYFYDQVPDSMRSLGIALYLSVIGAANFLSSFLITIVDHVTDKAFGKSWFGKDLNHSRLDLFYLVLAVITGVNLLVYICVARRYSYKAVQTRSNVVLADFYDGNAHYHHKTEKL